MKGLAEAVKNLRLTDFFAQGQRAYMIGIEKRDNPVNSPSGRTQWERGWEHKQNWFLELLKRWKTA